MPSNKKFAYNFSIIFLIIALILLYLKIFDLFYLFLFLSVLFLIGGKLKPKLFKYLNYGWNKFALILHHIISPVIIFLIFFTIITPFGVLGRLFSSDLKKKLKVLKLVSLLIFLITKIKIMIINFKC